VDGYLTFFFVSISQIEKYTAHSNHTGVYKDNQTLGIVAAVQCTAGEMLSAGFSEIRKRSHAFVEDRGWKKHDTAESLCLALLSEVGELADLVAWKSPSRPTSDFNSLRDKIAQELADVTIILLRLSDLHEIDLSQPEAYMTKHNINCEPSNDKMKIDHGVAHHHPGPLQKGFDPTMHGLPSECRTCECDGCRLHMNWICDEMCARPFLAHNGTCCSKCGIRNCEICSMHCRDCALSLCRPCDGCNECETYVCSTCVKKVVCTICEEKYCEADGERCIFGGSHCRQCDLVVCQSCGLLGCPPTEFEACEGVNGGPHDMVCAE